MAISHTLDSFSDGLVLVDKNGKEETQCFIWKHDLVIMFKKEENFQYSRQIHQMCLSDYDYDGMSRMLELMHERSRYEAHNMKFYDVDINGTEYIIGISAKPVDLTRKLDGIRLLPIAQNHIDEVYNYLSTWKEDNVTKG